MSVSNIPKTVESFNLVSWWKGSVLTSVYLVQWFKWDNISFSEMEVNLIPVLETSVFSVLFICCNNVMSLNPLGHFSKNIDLHYYYLWSILVINLFKSVKWLAALLCLLKAHNSSLFTGQDGLSCFQFCTSGTRFPLPLGLNFHMQVNHVFYSNIKIYWFHNFEYDG